MEESYYDNHAADRTGVVVGVPPWLKAVGYTDDITGLYGVFDLEGLLQNHHARDNVCHISKYGLMQIIGMKPSGLNSVVTRLTMSRFYRYVKNGKVRLKVMSWTPMQLSDRSWSCQLMYRLADNVTKNEWSKLFVGMISLTPSCSQTTFVPEVKPGVVVTVDLTGDADEVEMFRSAGTFKLKSELTTTQRLVGRPQSKTSDSGFFGRFWGSSKSPTTETLRTDTSQSTLDETLARLGQTHKLLRNADEQFDDDSLL